MDSSLAFEPTTANLIRKGFLMTKTYLSLAAYNYKRAAVAAQSGDKEKADRLLSNARFYDTQATQA